MTSRWLNSIGIILASALTLAGLVMCLHSANMRAVKSTNALQKQYVRAREKNGISVENATVKSTNTNYNVIGDSRGVQTTFEVQDTPANAKTMQIYTVDGLNFSTLSGLHAYIYGKQNRMGVVTTPNDTWAYALYHADNSKVAFVAWGFVFVATGIVGASLAWLILKTLYFFGRVIRN